MLYTSPGTSRQILTVTKLNRLARTILESEVGLVWLSAEISNFVCAASGHWYFTLKDNKAQVRAAMFKTANRNIRQRPKEGDSVLVRASVGLYEPRGDYQLVVEHLESGGEGQLKQEFDALKERLNAEGLFDLARKRPLPTFIRRIGIITSSSGAALHDALTVLKRRSPATEVIIYPSMVQGSTAPAQLINALNTANIRSEVDVILLTRGGGSLEDLWSFNNEALARCIAASRLPVVCAVGHEIDVTIADFAADLRAPTPSAGAELLSQDMASQKDRIEQLSQSLLRSWKSIFQSTSHRLYVGQQRLQSVHPSARLQAQSQGLDRLQLALNHAIGGYLVNAERRQNKALSRLSRFDPTAKLQKLQNRQQYAANHLIVAMQRKLKYEQQRMASQVQLLQSVSPLSTLARGYSITFKDGNPVTSTASLAPGQQIRTRLAHGELTSQIIDVTHSPKTTPTENNDCGSDPDRSN
ncbi:exodeoxyribonuclease VII large subunit [Alteromonas pelagimontana]|uniref:Exodeoxyribonuclease 7 large subunit n=1 Tax=Alteromonas pelagimontana TaxID=1858656 RepID=A0A6M4MGH5_9ALTE|nr:exodeoxyribonuclease VII large subunit [Alteromonas pelagimontana]QJR82047.1 exodeoxyribonuclease VII large subunit [Alteromonas pelagimontana]